MTASSLLGNDPTSLAHLSFGSFWAESHSSLSRLDGEHQCTAIARSLSRDAPSVPVWTLAGPLQDCHSFPGATSVFSWQYSSAWDPEHSGKGFHSGLLYIFLHPSFPLSWLVSQSASVTFRPARDRNNNIWRQMTTVFYKSYAFIQSIQFITQRRRV